LSLLWLLSRALAPRFRSFFLPEDGCRLLFRQEEIRFWGLFKERSGQLFGRSVSFSAFYSSAKYAKGVRLVRPKSTAFV
jgi:hypothetical protein